MKTAAGLLSSVPAMPANPPKFVDSGRISEESGRLEVRMSRHKRGYRKSHFVEDPEGENQDIIEWHYKHLPMAVVESRCSCEATKLALDAYLGSRQLLICIGLFTFVRVLGLPVSASSILHFCSPPAICMNQRANPCSTIGT